MNDALLDIGQAKYSEKVGMNSEHLLILASLAAKNFYPKKILEIGTYVGFTSCILASLFPTSNVTTIDLKDDDDNFKKSYNRREPGYMQNFLKVRNNYLKMKNNIIFRQEN